MDNSYDFILTRYRTILQFKDIISDIVIKHELSTKFGYTYYRIYVILNYKEDHYIREPEGNKYISFRIYDRYSYEEIHDAKSLGNDLVNALKRHLWFNPFGDDHLEPDLSKLIKDERVKYLPGYDTENFKKPDIMA
jgi:hypothetical protein